MFLDRLSAFMKVPPEQINSIIKEKDSHYHRFYIKKRNGGKRLVCAPDKTLQLIQRAVVRLVFKNYDCSKNTAAYEKGCSAAAAAQKHCGAKTVINADIKDFFSSISYNHVAALLKKKFSLNDIDLIWAIISLDKGLPVGAPSSPVVSNRIMRIADKKIAKAAKKCVYTRYADDMTFSSNKKIDAKRILDNVANVLRTFDFKLNEKKSKIRTGSERRQALGLILNNAGLSIGLRKRKKLKKDVYNYLTKGKGNRSRIQGKISYTKQIEPAFIKTLSDKYAKFESEKYKLGLVDLGKK